jgi:hypothetical protein
MEYIQGLAYDLKREFELPSMSRMSKSELVALAKTWENETTAKNLGDATGLPATGSKKVAMTGARPTPPPSKKAKPKSRKTAPPKNEKQRQQQSGGGQTNANPTCSRCGKPLSNPESVAAGIGPICEAHAGKSMAHEFTIDAGSEYDTDKWIPFTEGYNYVVSQGIPGNRLIKVTGGEGVIHEPFAKVFEPMYIGRKKYLQREAISPENIEYLKNQGWKIQKAAEEKALEAANELARKNKVRRKQ